MPRLLCEQTLATITTIGYGDVVSANELEVAVMCITICVSAVSPFRILSLGHRSRDVITISVSVERLLPAAFPMSHLT
jgi:hypothetical protein